MRRLRRIVVVPTAVMLGALSVVVSGAPSAPADGPVAYTLLVKGDGPGTQACGLARIDLTDGAVTGLAAPSSFEACVQDLAVGPDGAVYGLRGISRRPELDPENAGSENASADPATATDPGQQATPLGSVELVRFDPTSGAITAADPITGAFDTATLRSTAGLAFTTSGALYAEFSSDEAPCDLLRACLYEVDLGTHLATLVGVAGASTAAAPSAAATFLTIDCTDAAVTGYTAFVDPKSDEESVDAQAVAPESLADVGLGTGTYTPGPELSPPVVDAVVSGLEFDRPGGTLYAIFVVPPVDRTDVSVAAPGPGVGIVDRSTGAVTQVAPIGDPDLIAGTLAIAGSCPVGSVVQPIQVVPTFTG